MRIRSLDGLRAIAVIAVILHHQNLLPIGWIGVELFFVLSGFLITGILRKQKETPTYWSRFYIRRATRILPPVLFLIWIITVNRHPPVHSVLAYIFFLSNFVSLTSWKVDMLVITWSLAVEEHFYLLFPFAVRFMGKRSILYLLTAVVLVEPIARFVATAYLQASQEMIYHWTFFRLDGLTMGCMLALFLENERASSWLTRWSGYLAAGSAILFTASSLAFPLQFSRDTNGIVFNSVGYSLISITFALTVAFILQHPSNVMSRMLESKPLVFIASISYGMYLFHIPIMVHLKAIMHLSDLAVLPFSFTATVLFSWLSFKFYESYFTRLGHRATSERKTVAELERVTMTALSLKLQ